MFKLLYLPTWFFKTKFLGKKIPLQSVVFISNKCNLSCKHCCIYDSKSPVTNTYEEVKKDLEYCYSQGSRFVDFEGGEPMIWRDTTNPNDIKDINSLFRLAKEIGFFSCTVTTNAQLNFDNCAADSIWVSLDGFGQYHDMIRGDGAFDKLYRNIQSSPHPELSVNMVINSINYPSVKETIEFAKNEPHIKSISVNFHTPYPGTEELELDWNIRQKIIDEVIELKKEGYPIMNSVSGLKLMKHNKFKKYCWLCNFVLVDHTYLPECNGSVYNLCDRCGYGMAGEMNAVMHLKPDTILSGLKLRTFGK